MPPLLTPHFSIELRSHFTKKYITVVAFIGATENLVIQMLFFILPCIAPNSIGIFETIIYEQYDLRDIIIWFSFVNGVHYNLTNLYYAFSGAQDKLMALKYMIPYF